MDINNYFQKKFRQFPVVRQEDMPLYKPLQSESDMLENAKESMDYCSLYALGFRDSFIASLANANMLKIRVTTEREKENNGGAGHFTYLIADDCMSRNALYISSSGSVERELLAGSDPQALYVHKCDDEDIKNVLIFNNIIELLAYLQIAALIGNWPWQTIAIASVDIMFERRGNDTVAKPFQVERLLVLLCSLSLVNPLKISLCISKEEEYSLVDMLRKHIANASISRIIPSSLADKIDGLTGTDKILLRNSRNYYEVMTYLIRKIEQQKKENKKTEQAEFKTLFGNNGFFDDN